MITTPHIIAHKNAFAKTVLMPGDPKRSEYIAKTFLSNSVLVNDIRGIKGYTGFFNGKRISVMASGIGQPSMGIYSYELYSFFNVENIIRIGTCGNFNKDLNLMDIIIAMGACSNSNYSSQYNLPGTFAPIASYDLLEKAVKECTRNRINFKVGNILSSDTYYTDNTLDLAWVKMGILGVDMETAALYCNAARLNKKALSILSISDSSHKAEHLTALEREVSLKTMIQIALEIAE